MKIKEVKRDVVTAMVGTAGHVDHGKTTLVGMLTGCDTDGLAEEKKRGLSINLGFAPCMLPGRRMIGIVDVPGHRDFIRNMVAGAASIDVLMLVTAADDGVMPQTAEHMQIIRLLRKPKVMVVLTKIDLVDEETVELAIDDVATYMAKIGYPDVPILPASSVTGDGLMDVRKKLYELIDEVQELERDRRRFRMNVERSFSVEGYGTVATGIPDTGNAPVGGKLVLMPSGKGTTVRAVQVYKTDADAAVAGACAAINLREVGAEDLPRGVTLATPDTYQSVTEFVATLESVATDRPLKRRFQSKIHAGTSIGDATVKLVDVESLPFGKTALAHVKTQEPLTLTAGDRFVIRSLSPMTTVAGGSVLSVNPGKMKRSSPHLLPRLTAAAAALEETSPLAAELLAGGPVLFRRTDLLRLSRMEPADAEAAVADLVEKEILEDLGGGSYLVPTRLGELADRLAGDLKRYHDAHPYSWGMTSTHVCEVLELPAKSFKGATRALRRDERITLRHGSLARTDFEPALSAKQMKQKDEILSNVADPEARPPAIGDLAKRLGIASADMKLLVKMLTEEDLVRVVGSNLMSREVYDGYRAALLGLFEKSDEVGLGEWREATGLGRNLAWTLLEAFDVEGLTKKMGDVRVLARSAGEARGGDDG